VVALVALFVSLSGTAVAAGVVPMAKRALFAKNAGKLQGMSARQVAAMAGPASYARHLLNWEMAPFALAPGEEKDFTAHCGVDKKAISGGLYVTPNTVLVANSHPTDNGTSWTLHLINRSGSTSATGHVDVLCLV
jgi:hypothetical protein